MEQNFLSISKDMPYFNDFFWGGEALLALLLSSVFTCFKCHQQNLVGNMTSHSLCDS